MKKKILLFVLFLYTTLILAQNSYSERSFNKIGLPKGKEIEKSLFIAIPLLLIGFLLAYIFMWSKKNTEKMNNTSSNIGCFGIILMAIGAFFLLPLLAWVEFIFVSVWSVLFAIIIILAIIYMIYSAFKKK